MCVCVCLWMNPFDRVLITFVHLKAISVLIMHNNECNWIGMHVVAFKLYIYALTLSRSLVRSRFNSITFRSVFFVLFYRLCWPKPWTKDSKKFDIEEMKTPLTPGWLLSASSHEIRWHSIYLAMHVMKRISRAWNGVTRQMRLCVCGDDANEWVWVCVCASE